MTEEEAHVTPARLARICKTIDLTRPIDRPLLKEDDPEANRKGLLRSAYGFWAHVWSAFFAVVVVSIGFPFVGAGGGDAA